MAKAFQITNEQRAASIVSVVDYLRGKFLKAEQQMGVPVAEITSEFTDETGQQWQLTLSRKSTTETTSQ